MSQLRLAAAVSALCLSFLGCPPGGASSDGGAGDGGDGGAALGGCTGGCGPNLVCDTIRHVCIDPCEGCASGVCRKNDSGQYRCEVEATTCGVTACGPGQTTCAAGTCSCLDSSRGGVDTCAPYGSVCHGLYNPVTQAGGTCDAPRRYDECRTSGCEGGSCIACSGGLACVKGLFGDEIGTCLKPCPNGTSDCDVDERCDTQAQVCYPRSLFTSLDCPRIYPFDGGVAPDGGTVSDAGEWVVAGVVGEGCTVVADDGSHEPDPTGNCSYSLFQLSTQQVQIPNCRPAGTAGRNALCRRDFSAGAAGTRCGSGLECVLTRGDEGLCLRLCNASAPGGCADDEACVNLHRVPGRVSSLGACMRQCDVLARDGGDSCPGYGATQATCVPAPADGLAAVSDDGKGFCVPQQASAAAIGAPCAEVDPLRGAACAEGGVCNPRLPAPLCEQPCDLACAKSPAPARCNTEANARCPNGKHCTAVNSTSTAILGFCR